MVDGLQDVKIQMEIDIAGMRVTSVGVETAISSAALESLVANGGLPLSSEQAATEADILLLSWSLMPRELDRHDGDGLISVAGDVSDAMSQRGYGSLIFLLSAVAAVPMRRHMEYSKEMAKAVTAMRCLSMGASPDVRVNALGFGCIGNAAAVSGDASMLTHVPLERHGLLSEAVAAVLFMADPANSYTSGQLLAIDGGWSVGYGRNF